jgi:REP element-mobilizing transposase RayT
MPGTFTLLLYHLVWSTKGREPWIHEELRDRLYGFTGGIIRDEGGTLLIINGVADHVHLLVRWGSDGSLSHLIRNIKARSSRWMHQTFADQRRFAWQEGYAAFTVSPSQKAKTIRYIENQEQHHRRRDFKSELRALLDAHGIEHDPKYLD